MQIKQYQATEAPYHLPNDLDLLAWSFPFLAEKVVSMLYCIVASNPEYTPSAHEIENVDFSKLIFPKDESNCSKLNL